MQHKVSMPIFAVLALSMALTACAPTAPTATVEPAKPTEAAAAPATEAPKTDAAATSPAKVDFNTVKSAEEAGGMDALIAAAKAEGELNVITLPAIGVITAK